MKICLTTITQKTKIRRILIIDSNVKYKLENNNVKIINEDSKEESYIFLNDLDLIVFRQMQLNISIGLILALFENKVSFLIEYLNKPFSTINPLYGSFDIYGKIENQFSIKNKFDYSMIVKAKIKQQFSLLKKLNLDGNLDLNIFLNKIKENDEANIEGQFAKIYFHKSFGINFNRKLKSNINDLLNYGYGILASYISCNLVYKGYNTSIGLHHCSKTNSYNLSYDIIEIFRPYVDEIVFCNKESSLTKEIKEKLISVLQLRIIYENKTYILGDFIKMYIDLLYDSVFDFKKLIYGN